MAARCGMRATRQFKGQPGFGGATRMRNTLDCSLPPGNKTGKLAKAG